MSASMRILDLSETNLCNCSPAYVVTPDREWNGEAILALSEALLNGASLNRLILNGNELCGQWVEHVAGEWRTLGAYTTVAVDALIEGLRRERVTLKRDGIRVENNTIRVADEKRIQQALIENERLPKKVAPIVLSPSKAVKDAGSFKLAGRGDASAPDAQAKAPSTEKGEGVAASLKSKRAASLSTHLDVLDGAVVDDRSGKVLDAAPAPSSEDAIASEVWSEGREDAMDDDEAAAPDADDGLPPSIRIEDDGKDENKQGGAAASPAKSPSKSPAKKAVKLAKPEAPKDKAPKSDDNSEPKARESMSYRPTAKSGNKKKEKESVEEEVVDPLADLPLMIATAALQVRVAQDVDSDKVAGESKVPVGALMRVVDEVEFVTGITKLTTRRLKVVLDGDSEPLGWVTGLTTESIENVKIANAGFPLMRAAKVLICREGKENRDKKLDDIPRHTLLRVIDKSTRSDGVVKACVGRDGPVKDVIGWITLSKPDSPDEVNLEEVPTLASTFDLKTHTANALTRALARKVQGSTKQAVVSANRTRRKSIDGSIALPCQERGRRPATKSPDDGLPSRHSLVTQPASMMLLINCAGAAFEVTEWTGSLPFDLPGEQSFDLLSKKKRRKLGRVRIPSELGTPFLERVEFPDEWVPAEECGVDHDGWQGDGTVELELTCGKDTATIRLSPWLAYGCTVGARVSIRSVSASAGQCATVHRVLGDDRVVARVDGFGRDAGVKAEVIVDVSPKTVVPTSGPGFDRGAKLLLLFRNKLVDAVVMEWTGKINIHEGSRHMVNVKPPGASTGTPAWPSLNVFNHVAAAPGVTATTFEEVRNRYCEWVASNQDTVEDAITGNLLPIKEQLIFMQAVDVKDGCVPPEYMSVTDVPQLVERCAVESPLRVHGLHNAQPVLCRAGPGTGKTWMIKQTMYLLAVRLMADAAGEGLRLMPFVVYVQRVVRLLNEHGDEPSVLLSDPEGMMRWYIKNECADSKERCQLLLTAYEMRGLVLLVDGVDEAAGMRDVIEAFVHYELVTSGNRLIVTSRPEGVDLEDYRRKFVVMNLTELSQEQQRNVIQMQLQGNKFFEHLVNLGECRRDLNERYKKGFASETIRNEIQSLTFVERAPEVDTKTKEKEKVADEDDDEEEDEDPKRPLSRAEAAALAAEKAKVVLVPEMRVAPIRRRVSLDNQLDLHAWLDRAIPELAMPMKSAFLQSLHKVIMAKTKDYANLLDQLDLEIKNVTSPCTRAQLDEPIKRLAAAQPRGRFAHDVSESLVQLATIRKVPLPGGRRGAKAAPMPAQGLWCQVVRVVDDKYLAVQKQVRLLNEALARLASVAGVPSLSLKRHPDFARLPPSLDEAYWLPHSAETLPEIQYRDPVALWVDSTYPGATEPTEQPLPAWVASVVLRGKTGDQCLALIKLILQGVELEIDGEPTLITPLSLQNTFSPDALHPTRVRRAACHAVLTTREGSIAVQLIVEHHDMAEQYEKSAYATHYNYFWDRVLGMTQATFDVKFETLLIFLVEAIGIPVLLSLLLLTYSSTGGETIDLEELPLDRLQLYKLGIMSGIRKRLALAIGESTGAAEVREEEADQNKRKREKRKVALEQNLGGSSSSQQQEQQNAFVARAANADPVLDLNSMLRGKKVRVVNGENEVAEAYALVVRVLDRVKNADLRTAISAIVPKSHSLHAVVTAFVEYVLAPISVNEQALYETGKKMLRDVAVDNQQNGRREFTSRHVACALGAAPEELGLWTRLDLDHDHGVALTATLSKQTEKAPAQYQFKHLSFQEGLYAEYLLMLITSLQAPGPGWAGWATDTASAGFLNNRYMNNTCRIAAGHLGSLLAKQRAHWDFREAPLTPNGRQALWFITDDNDTVASINVSHNDVSLDDVAGLSKTIGTCSKLVALDLSENELHTLSTDHMPEWRRVCEALGGNTTLTDLNLNRNRLGPAGIRVLCKALLKCSALQRLGLSYNEPGIEPAMSDFFRAHPSLVSVELVEATERHFPNRAKDDIGRALIDNKVRTLGFLHCDTFVLSQETTSLVWPKEASTSDAVLLAGALVTNTVLTTFNIAPGASLANMARSALGEALLNNPGSRLAFCNDFGLQPNVSSCEFDLSKPELKEVEPFRLLAGCLRGNRTLTHVTLKQLRSEQISTLALALRGNSTLSQLDIIHLSRQGGQSVVRLPVPELNGSKAGASEKRVDMSPACLEGSLNRVACEMIGTLIAANTSLQCLDLSNTGVGLAIGAEGEGGHILLRPLCESKLCPIEEINLTNVQLSDKAGAKLLTSLSSGMGKRNMGYEKITSLSLAKNELGDATGSLLKEVLWGERAPCTLRYLDLSFNSDLSGHDIALAVRRNESLTSLDIRNIPSANTDSVFTSIGSFLLQEECACRLGFLLCNSFEVRAGQTELRLEPPPARIGSDGKPLPPAPRASIAKDGSALSRVKQESVLQLLAGILKFNSSLTRVEILNMGLDDKAANDYYCAIKENTVLEYLDLSRNPVGAAGIAEISEAVRAHPQLAFFKIDGAALPVPQVCGRAGTGGDAKLEMDGWELGPLSGHAIGTIAKVSSSLTDIDLKNNSLGADGAAAVVNGLGASPIKLLDLARNGVGAAMDEEGTVGVGALSMAICAHLGLLLELRMDENELECDVEDLAPLCKLRSLRTLSMDKNRLTQLPPLIGTVLSLRKLSLHSNQLTSLPATICLLVNLDTLDLHKNSLRALPPNLGHLHSLQRLDLSENKIAELPISICELNESAQVSVGRNPLEKPSIEQARQGIGAIRRFFGYSRAPARALPDDNIEALVAKRKEKEEKEREKNGVVLDKATEEAAREAREEKRPHHLEGTPSRHGWAAPAGVITLFNCQNAQFTIVDGSSDVEAVPPDETAELSVAFNLQIIGRVRACYSAKVEPFADRVEFKNMWLPWRNQDVDPGEDAALTVTLKWGASGKAQEKATLLVTPWLAYGCSVGARVKTATQYATVSAIRSDDMCEIVADNTKHNVALLGPEVIDPRPDVVSRTSTSAYKAGQKLLLLHEGVPVDAVVEEWLGLRRGSRHRVRIGAKASLRKAASVSDKHVLEVDLNEANHTKLLFSTVTKYEATRQQYCDTLMTRHRYVKEEALLGSRDVPAGDQRMLVDSWVPVVAEELNVGATTGEEAAAEDGSDAEPPPDAGRAASAVPSGDAKARGRKGKYARAATASASLGPESNPAASGMPQQPQRSSSPQTTRDVLGDGSGAHSDAPAAAALVESASPAEPPVNVLRLVDELVAADLTNGRRVPPVLLRAGHPVEHEMLHKQVLYSLASKLRDMVAQKGAVRLVPLPISAAKLCELMADEQTSKLAPRALIVKAFELENPGYVEMIKQAMEMRAIVLVAKVADPIEAAPLQDAAILEELSSMRLILSCCSPSELPVRLPMSLTERSLCKQMHSVSLVLARARIGEKDCKTIFKRLRVRPEGIWPLVQGVHLSFAEIGRESLSELQELLGSRSCALRTLDLSQTQVDAWPVIQTLVRAPSVTALDLRRIPGAANLYSSMAEALFGGDSRCALSFLRCDAFEILEDEKVLSLRETPLDEMSQPGAMALLAGLLQRNTTLREVDLSATDLDKGAATALAKVLATNQSLTSLKLCHNAALDDEAHALLRKAANKRSTPLNLQL